MNQPDLRKPINKALYDHLLSRRWEPQEAWVFADRNIYEVVPQFNPSTKIVILQYRLQVIQEMGSEQVRIPTLAPGFWGWYWRVVGAIFQNGKWTLRGLNFHWETRATVKERHIELKR